MKIQYSTNSDQVHSIDVFGTSEVLTILNHYSAFDIIHNDSFENTGFIFDIGRIDSELYITIDAFWGTSI